MPGTARDLADAIKALVPTSVAIGSQTVAPQVFDVSTGSTTAPANLYYVVHVATPSVDDRSESASPIGHLTRVRVTSVGRTSNAARDLASAVESSLDQGRPVAAGWLCGPLLLRNTRGPDVDHDVTFTDGARAIYAVSEFELITSRTA